MTKIGDPNHRVLDNPNYRAAVNGRSYNWWGFAKDMAGIIIGSVSGGLGLVSTGTATGATASQVIRYGGAAAAAGGAADRAQSSAEAHPEDGNCVIG